MLTAFAVSQHQPSPSAAAQDASSNADLAQISMTLNERLIPRFDPAITAYTIRMTQSNVISGYTYIQANPKESDATITVTSGGREYSAPTYTIPVSDFGVAQEVQIKVTAPDGVTTKTYTLTTQPLPTPTPTPIPTATPIPTPTPIPTNTPVPTETPEVSTECWKLRSIIATATPMPANSAANDGDSSPDHICSYPKLDDLLERDVCYAIAQITANPGQSSGASIPERTFSVYVMLVEGGSSRQILEFLKTSGVDFIDYGYVVSADDVPASALGTLSKFPDVRVVFPDIAPIPVSEFISPEQSSAENPAVKGMIPQTLTEASMWH